MIIIINRIDNGTSDKDNNDNENDNNMIQKYIH